VVCLRVLSRTNPPPRSTPNSFRFRTSAQPCILHCFGANKSFRIRTYRHPSCNPFRIRTYRNTGGWGASPLVQGLRVSVSLPAPALSGWQIPCSQQLAASCTSLCAFFRTPFLCFQELAASFSKTPGVGVPQHFRAELCFRRHIRHEEPPSPGVSTGCAYFLSPQGCATPLPRPKGEGPARCSPCRRLPRPGGQSFRDFQTFRPLRSPLVTGHSPLRFPLQWVT